MLVVTHELSFAQDVSSKAVLLNTGEIEEEAMPAEFFPRPRRIGWLLKQRGRSAGNHESDEGVHLADDGYAGRAEAGSRPAQFMLPRSLPMRSPVASLAIAAIPSCASSKSKIAKFDAM